MRIKNILKSGGVILRQIELADCTTDYVNWLNDVEVNRYLETRWSRQTLQTVKKFVSDQLDSEHSILLAIVLPDDRRHIGNIKLGMMNKHHHFADISYFIGDKSMWGKGIATKCINMISDYGIHSLNLHRIEAGAYAANEGSWRALEKNGFVREATFRARVISENDYMDSYRYGLLAEEYKMI